MSDVPPAAHEPGLQDTVHEVQGSFPNDAAYQDALSRLSGAGFDRSTLSLLPPPEDAEQTPDEAGGAPSNLDARQIRTMSSGLTGAAGGMGVAAVLASGGLAAPLVAAAAIASAVGVSAATTGAGVVADEAGSSERDRLGAAGKLVLAVRIANPEQASMAEAAMREAGASEVRQVRLVSEAVTRGVSATSWTGMP